MDERMRFVMEYERAEVSLSELCRRYGVSRKTGYKWLWRYGREGVEGLRDRSRAPKHQPHAVDAQMERRIVQARGEHPTWGPRKLKVWLEERYAGVPFPAPSTIGAILQRAGLTVSRRRRRRCEPYTRPFRDCETPNRVWCADFKGWFRLGNGERCEPLTISDAHTRFLLRCQALPNIRTAAVQRLFEATFRECGLPEAIRTDNGVPFASHGLGGLSRLSVWWIKLGIVPERIAPGKPQQNGRHERMHLTLQQETSSPAQANLRRQQRRFDQFRQRFNHERPHEALGQIPPGRLYQPSPRLYPSGRPQVQYRASMTTRKVQKRGQVYWKGTEVFLTETLAGETVGFEPVDDRHWSVYFGPLKLAVFDSVRCRVMPLTKPRRR